jgi:hypothetical protein
MEGQLVFGTFQPLSDGFACSAFQPGRYSRAIKVF